MAKWQDTLKVIKKLTNIIRTKKVLVIDPSSGGGESRPGFAIILDGQVKFSGIIDVPLHYSLQSRLVKIRSAVEDLVEIYGGGFSLLVLEEIRIIPGTFSGPSVANLLKGVGAAMSAIETDYYLEIPPLQWKKYAVNEGNYTKSDEQDAIYIAKFLLHLANEFAAGTGPQEKQVVRKAPSTRKVNLCQIKKTKSSRASRPASPHGRPKSQPSKN